MSRTTISVLLLCFSLGASAESALRDFAFQASLGNSTGSLQRIELPAAVIAVLAHPDFADLAIFNVDGKALPHSVLRTPARVEERELELPFHEFERFLQQSSKTVTIREQNRENGALSELETTEQLPVHAVRKDYLVELAPDDEPRAFERIEIDWSHQPASRLLDLRVEIGDDLDRLRVIRKRKSLALKASNDSAWRSIENIPAGHKYLRLTSHPEVDSFNLHRVTGFYRHAEAPPRISFPVDAERVEDENGVFYRVALPSAVSPAAIRLRPRDNNSVIAGDLYVGSADGKRLLRRGFRQHNIDDAQVRPSAPLDLPHRFDGDIWFTSNSELPASPQVELIYLGHEILFLGDGNGPYTLAWGNHNSKAHASELASLLDGSLEDARGKSIRVGMGAVQEAGGAARLAPQPALPWQKWLLWGLLLVAALITGRMAYRLYREMNHPDPA